MKAVRCNAFGPPEALVVEDLPGLQAGAGEVVVEVKAAGVNFPDALIIQDKYQIKPTLPFSPGGELAGVISAVGEGVTRFRVGDAVIGFTGWGAFAQEAVLDAGRLVPMPDTMPFEVAGSFLMTYGTCYHALVDRAQLAAGETVLVLGAAGGIGLAAIEIAVARGARVIAAASSEDKLRTCREHGATETINYETQDLREQLKQLTGGAGVDVVCDPVGGRFSEPALRSMAWRGRYLVIGFTGGDIPRIALNLPLLKGCAIVGVFWGDFLRREPANGARDLAALADLYAQGRIRPHVSGCYGLAQTGAALRAIMERRVQGKIVIVP